MSELILYKLPYFRIFVSVPSHASSAIIHMLRLISDYRRVLNHH